MHKHCNALQGVELPETSSLILLHQLVPATLAWICEGANIHAVRLDPSHMHLALNTQPSAGRKN